MVAIFVSRAATLVAEVSEVSLSAETDAVDDLVRFFVDDDATSSEVVVGDDDDVDVDVEVVDELVVAGADDDPEDSERVVVAAGVVDSMGEAASRICFARCSVMTEILLPFSKT